MNLPVPCIVCGSQLESAAPRAPGNQPSGGVGFNTSGHYGSTVYDPMDDAERLEITVCDKCLIDAAQAGRVVRVASRFPARVELEVKLWEPDA